MTTEERQALYRKFDRDITKRRRFWRFLLAVDQLFNVLIFDGSQDETISSHIYRRIESGRATKIEHGICWMLRRVTRSSHCYESRGE